MLVIKQYKWKKNNCVLDLNKLSTVKVRPFKQIKRMNENEKFTDEPVCKMNRNLVKIEYFL